MGRTNQRRRLDRATWAREHVIIHKPFAWSFGRMMLVLAITLGLGGAMATPVSAAARHASGSTSAADLSIEDTFSGVPPQPARGSCRTFRRTRATRSWPRWCSPA